MGQNKIARTEEREKTSKDTLGKKQENQLLILAEVSKAVTSTLEIEKVLKMIVKEAVVLINAQVCSLRFLDRESKDLVLAASYGHTAEYKREKKILKINESIAGWAVKKRSPVIVEDVQSDKRYKFLDQAKKEKLRSLLSVPMLVGNNVIGILNVYTTRTREFTKSEVNLLTLFAEQAAVAIENARLYKRLHDVYMKVIATLARLIDAKDDPTYDHSRQVSAYAIVIARHMHLSQERIKNLEYASHLHDIGKIAIDKEILSKPGKLTQEEWQEIRLHPVHGAAILAPLDFFHNVVSIVRSHHERYDGKGYPDRLKADDICLEAKIIAVADSYHAMISKRPYRESLTKEEAIKELKKNSGTQFDPKVVKIFLEILKKEEALLQ